MHASLPHRTMGDGTVRTHWPACQRRQQRPEPHAVLLFARILLIACPLPRAALLLSAHAVDKAAAGYTFVALDDSFPFYADVLARRYSGAAAGTSASTSHHPMSASTASSLHAAPPAQWRALAAAAHAAAEALARAQCCVTGAVHGPALRQAEEVLGAALELSLGTSLCGLLEATRHVAAAAGQGDGAAAEAAAAAGLAAMRAMAALVAAPPRGVVCAPGQPAGAAAGAAGQGGGGGVSDHFPLARTLSSRHLGGARDKGERGRVWPPARAQAAPTAAHPACISSRKGGGDGSALSPR